MIDTDKYEGHEYERMRIERWHLPDTPEEVMIANALLMDDAPLLLAEVKRLREAMKTMLDDMNNASPEEDIEYWLDTWKHWLKEMIK